MPTSLWGPVRRGRLLCGADFSRYHPSELMVCGVPLFEVIKMCSMWHFPYNCFCMCDKLDRICQVGFVGAWHWPASGRGDAYCDVIIPPATKLRGYIGFTLSLCLSVSLSVCLSVCLSINLSCPPCSIYSSGWILSIFGTNDQ